MEAKDAAYRGPDHRLQLTTPPSSVADCPSSALASFSQPRTVERGPTSAKLLKRKKKAEDL